MSAWTLIILAVGLSADAFAVSIGKGLQIRDRVTPTALTLGAAFGFAQALMPIIGWYLGSTFADRVSGFAPWIAFVLLAIVGGKMLFEAFMSEDDEALVERGSRRQLSLNEVTVLAVATSIDALAVGVSLAVLEVSIWWTSAVIGAITFVLSSAAVFIGHSIGTRFRSPAEIAGGLILIGIGIRVLVG